MSTGLIFNHSINKLTPLYSQMMDKINSLNHDVERLKIENEVLTKRSKLSITSTPRNQFDSNDKENIVTNQVNYMLGSTTD